MFLSTRDRRSLGNKYNSTATTPKTIDMSTGGTVEYVKSDRMDALQQHLKELLEFVKMKCNYTVLSKPKPTDGLYCPAEFDGWSCLNYTKAGDTAYINCPPLPIFNVQEKAFRHCTINGTWEIFAESGRPWTNTSNCADMNMEDDDHHYYSCIYLFLAGAALSLILLVISLTIFFWFVQLRCDRVVIHQNFFISLVLTAVSMILYYTLVVMDGDVILDNPVWCQVLHVLCQYFITCNFCWMFCESLYLHIIMTYALTTGKKLIKIIIAFGWGIPIPLTLCYAAVRASDDVINIECWVITDNLLWIAAGPIVLSVLLNILMLINLVRLLVTKLQQIPEASQNKKAAKAILILVPLFGLQLILFPARPEQGTLLDHIYLHVMAFLMSTQGTFVSIILCFFNGEVRSLLRRKWQQHLMMSGRTRKNLGLTSSTYDPYSVIDTSREISFHKTKVSKAPSLKDTLELKPLADDGEEVMNNMDA